MISLIVNPGDARGCARNDGFCTRNDGLCTKDDGFALKMTDFVLEMMEFVLTTMDFFQHRCGCQTLWGHLITSAPTCRCRNRSKNERAF